MSLILIGADARQLYSGLVQGITETRLPQV